MTAIDHGMKMIRRAIQPQILEMALTLALPEEIVYSGLSIDDLYITHVIKAICVEDSDVNGGIQASVPLAGLQFMYDKFNRAILSIPKERTMNRHIIAALGVGPTAMNNALGYGPGTPVGHNASYNNRGERGNCGTPDNWYMGQGARLRKSFGTADTGQIVSVQLGGPNIVIIQGLGVTSTTNLSLTCRIENDPELNNIQPASWKHFGELCVLAAKMYIYINCDFAVSSGALQGGASLDRVRSVLDKYENAYEDYHTYLEETWISVMHMNDRTSWQDTLRESITMNW